jgi:hypothetical protein
MLGFFHAHKLLLKFNAAARRRFLKRLTAVSQST